MNESPHPQPEYGESWQDIVSGAPASEPDPVDETAPAPTGRGRGVARAAGLALAGLLAGVVGVSAMQAASGGTPTAATGIGIGSTAAQGGVPGQGAPPVVGLGQGSNGQEFDGQGFDGQGFDGQGQGFNGQPQVGGQGGFVGEMRLMGTLTAVGSTSVTVRTDAGTSTYAVSSATDIERDGQPVALSALKVGDAVLVHVLPSGSGSGYVAERVLAGASGGPAGGQPPATTGRTT